MKIALYHNPPLGGARRAMVEMAKGLAAVIQHPALADLSITGASAAQRANASSWKDLVLQTVNVCTRR